MPDEVRHYIATTDMGNLHAKLTGAFEHDSWEPMPLNRDNPASPLLFRVDEPTALAFMEDDEPDLLAEVTDD